MVKINIVRNFRSYVKYCCCYVVMYYKFQNVVNVCLRHSVAERIDIQIS